MRSSAAKKLLFRLLAASAILLVLTGCGGSGGTETADAGDTFETNGSLNWNVGNWNEKNWN